MNNESFFVTGAKGCIGAWVVRNLVYQGVPTTIFDLSPDQHRLELIMSREEIAQIAFVITSYSIHYTKLYEFIRGKLQDGFSLFGY